MIFTVNHFTLISLDRSYAKEELETIITNAKNKASETVFSDFSNEFFEILKKSHGIFPLFQEKFEKSEIHFEISIKEDGDLPF